MRRIHVDGKSALNEDLQFCFREGMPGVTVENFIGTSGNGADPYGPVNFHKVISDLIVYEVGYKN